MADNSRSDNGDRKNENGMRDWREAKIRDTSEHASKH